MTPHDAFHFAIDGHRDAVAAATGWCPSMVKRLALDPAAEGKPNPVQRLIEIECALTECGSPHAGFLLQYACVTLGYLPPIKAGSASDPASLDPVARFTKEFSEIVGAHARAMENGILSVSDAETMIREICDAFCVLGSWLMGLQQFTADATPTYARKGPKRAKAFPSLRRATA